MYCTSILVFSPVITVAISTQKVNSIPSWLAYSGNSTKFVVEKIFIVLTGIL